MLILLATSSKILDFVGQEKLAFTLETGNNLPKDICKNVSIESFTLDSKNLINLSLDTRNEQDFIKSALDIFIDEQNTQIVGDFNGKVLGNVLSGKVDAVLENNSALYLQNSNLKIGEKEFLGLKQNSKIPLFGSLDNVKYQNYIKNKTLANVFSSETLDFAKNAICSAIKEIRIGKNQDEGRDFEIILESDFVEKMLNAKSEIEYNLLPKDPVYKKWQKDNYDYQISNKHFIPDHIGGFEGGFQKESENCYKIKDNLQSQAEYFPDLNFCRMFSKRIRSRRIYFDQRSQKICPELES